MSLTNDTRERGIEPASRRIALAVLGRPPASPRDYAAAERPRNLLFDDLLTDRYDASLLGAAGETHRIPELPRLAAAIHHRRNEYDAIITWGERLTFSLLALQAISRARKPHVALMYHFSKANVRLPMRILGGGLSAIVTWSSVQRDFAIERLGIPAGRIYLVKHFVDQVFWNASTNSESDIICSAGSEMRDYGTLFEALRGTDLKCHVASDHVRVQGLVRARTVPIGVLAKGNGANVSVGPKTPEELRAMYSRARFVVVPVLPNDSDNGITVILEAMAMGKPVICSRTRGQVDVIREGETGLFVPVGDPGALRKAMLSLWNDPGRARAMGRAARAHVEKYHTIDKFSFDVMNAVNASLDSRWAAPDGRLPC